MVTEKSKQYNLLIHNRGETSRLLKEKNWDVTELGKIETWPGSLRNAINFILNAKFPMFLFWGESMFFFFNDKWYENFNIGASHEALLGEPAGKIFSGLWQSIEPIVKRVFEGDESVVGKDHVVPVTDFNKLVVTEWQISFCPVHNETGLIKGALANINEVYKETPHDAESTITAETEKKLAQLSSILHSSDDAIIGMSNQGIISGWNEAAERIFGYTAQEIIGKEADIMLPAHKQHEEELITSQIKKGHRINKLITQRLTKSKQLLDISLSITPLFNDKGIFIGVSKIARDITNQKRNEQLILESEERLQIVLSASDLGTWELNLVTNEVKYSKKYLEILGYNQQQLFTHQELLRHIHPADFRIRERAMQEALNTGVLSYEFRVVWSDGSVRWVEAKGQVFYNENNQPQKLIGTFRDITERRNMLAELRESEQKFRILADSVPQLIWTGDPNGNLNYFNFSLFEYSGLSPEQIHKEGWIQIVHPVDRLQSVKQWARSVDEGVPFLLEHRLKRVDGEYRWHLSRALPQRDRNGLIHMWVGTSTDVHDQKVFSEELEKNVESRTAELKGAIDELVKTNQELEQFAYVSSHDLQEPLRKIQTFSGILVQKLANNDESRLYLEKINASANRMSELIKDLLNYSKLSKTHDLYVETDLNEILERVKSDFEVLIQQKKAIIIGPRLPVVKAIPIQMNQLLYNLIGNSLKFCEKKPFIEISYARASNHDIKKTLNLNPSGEYFHILFRDNGIGFSQEYAQQIFTIFQRLHDAQKYGGTGIGLAMCKKIVDNHGGSISAESEPGKGTTFHVYLPYYATT